MCVPTDLFSLCWVQFSYLKITIVSWDVFFPQSRNFLHILFTFTLYVLLCILYMLTHILWHTYKFEVRFCFRHFALINVFSLNFSVQFPNHEEDSSSLSFCLLNHPALASSVDTDIAAWMPLMVLMFCTQLF